MFEMMIHVLPTIVILGILISVHELGHFLACRLTGVKVDKFCIGFGPELLAWQGKETRYSLALIPFGGFVKPQGESEDDVEKEGGTRPGDFLSASAWRRTIIIVAGVVMNFVFAYLLFVYVFIAGRPITGTMIAGFVEGYPAQTSGLQEGDRIQAVNQVNVKSWQDLLYEISKNKGEPINFRVDRAGQIMSMTVAPKMETGKDIFGIERKVAKIGIKPDIENYFIEKYTWKESFIQAYQLEAKLTALTYEALWKLVNGQLSLKTVSGPIGIAAMAGSAYKLGLSALIQFTAVLSVSLAVVNLLPIPALDGGHLLFLLIEIVTRRKVSVKFQDRVTQIGFMLLMVLMVLVVFNDLVNVGFFERVKEFFAAKMPSFPNW